MKPLLILLLAAVLMLAALPATAQHVWTDSLAIGASATDSAFVIPWRTLRLMPSGCDMLIRIGAPDTSSWASRKWLLVPEKTAFVFESANFTLRRLEWMAASGTGSLYWAGTKSTSQY